MNQPPIPARKYLIAKLWSYQWGRVLGCKLEKNITKPGTWAGLHSPVPSVPLSQTSHPLSRPGLGPFPPKFCYPFVLPLGQFWGETGTRTPSEQNSCNSSSSQISFRFRIIHMRIKPPSTHTRFRHLMQKAAVSAGVIFQWKCSNT